MNTHNEERDDTFNAAYNPFPEPQTIPSGWDFAALTSTPETDSTEDSFVEASN